MGEFLTVDVLADTIAVLGALGFFFLGYQAQEQLSYYHGEPTFRWTLSNH